MVQEPFNLLPRIENAGAIFLGAVQLGAGRRLFRWAEPYAADERHGPFLIAAECGRFSEKIERYSL